MKNKRTGRRSKKKIALAVICGILAVFFLVIMPVMSVSVYQGNFGTRFETVDWAALSPDDFDGLKVTECTFESKDGQQLAGYQYTKDDLQARGVVVLAHGLGGGGQNTYMDLADFFTSNGYYVFAYDATGNDKSEGDSVKGLPPGDYRPGLCAALCEGGTGVCRPSDCAVWAQLGRLQCGRRAELPSGCEGGGGGRRV